MGVQFYFKEGIEKLVNSPENDDNYNTSHPKVAGVVTTSGNIIVADHVILACGAQMGEVARDIGIGEVPVYPVKGYALTLRIGTSPSQSSLQCRHNITQDGAKIYLAPLGKDRIRVSGYAEFGEGHLNLDPVVVRTMIDRATKIMKPGYLADVDSEGGLIDVSVGLRPVSPDDVAIVGPAPTLTTTRQTGRRDPHLPYSGMQHYKNLWINGGGGSKGWTMSFGAARLLAELIDDDDELSIDPTPYSPLRFAARGGPWRTAVGGIWALLTGR